MAKNQPTTIPMAEESSAPQKKKRGRPKGHKNIWSPVIGDNGVHQDPGDNTKNLTVIKEFMSWGPANLDNIEELEDRFQRFVDYCIENDVRVTNKLCYMACGISGSTISDWERGVSRYSDPRYSAFIKKMKDFCAINRELMMNSGKLNPVTGIWWQKQYDGMKEQVETTVNVVSALGEAKSADELRAKYVEELPPSH